MTYVTVNSTSSRRDDSGLGTGFLNEISCYSDLCGESKRAPAYGFCDSPNCLDRVKGSDYGGLVFTIKGSLWGYITSDQSINDCKYCDQALYWSNKYTTRTYLEYFREQRKAK